MKIYAPAAAEKTNPNKPNFKPNSMPYLNALTPNYIKKYNQIFSA